MRRAAAAMPPLSGLPLRPGWIRRRSIRMARDIHGMAREYSRTAWDTHGMAREYSRTARDTHGTAREYSRTARREPYNRILFLLHVKRFIPTIRDYVMIPRLFALTINTYHTSGETESFFFTLYTVGKLVLPSIFRIIVINKFFVFF
jgi:hypothetical protein